MDFNVNYNHQDLRRVETVFSLRKLNKYQAKGHVTLVEKIRLNEELFTRGYIFRDRETGEYIEAESRHYATRREGFVVLPEDEFEKICPVKRYVRRRSLTTDWAAYVLPLDVQEGEELYIANLIEDVLVTEFGVKRSMPLMASPYGMEHSSNSSASFLTRGSVLWWVRLVS